MRPPFWFDNQSHMTRVINVYHQHPMLQICLNFCLPVSVKTVKPVHYLGRGGVALPIHFLALASIWLQTKVTKMASFLDLSHHTTATIPQLLIMKTNRRALSITLPTKKNQFDYFLVTLLFNKILRSAVSGFK